MISVIITSYKEHETIPRVLERLADPKYTGYHGKLEIIQVSPDQETLDAGQTYISSLKRKDISFQQVQDLNIGKPAALNLGFNKCKSSIVVLTDGDVFFERGALSHLISEFKESNFSAACGEVLSINEKHKFFGYLSHMMTAAAHHKRMVELQNVRTGYGVKFITKKGFFPLSGYIMILDKGKIEKKLKKNLTVPADCLVDDAYLSYIIHNAGLKLGYLPSAKVYVKFPESLQDFLKQKKRSTGGYVQLWKYGVVSQKTKSRSFWQDLEYFWFPLKYASSFREYIYSIMYYPLRLILWIQIWWERKVLKKDFSRTWVRIESTK